MEKKLTDEEIVKALENCVNGDYKTKCKGCYCDKLKNSCLQMDKDVLALIHRLQSENERLNEEANQDTITHIDICTENLSLRKQNAELQKQVDELKLDLENWKKASYGYKYAEEQAVKDTAKEIFDWLKSKVIMTEIPHGGEPSEEDVEAVMWWQIEERFKKRYGVEVK